MRIIKRLFAAMLLMAVSLSLPSCAQAASRALLVACSDFASHPDLGNAVSGNIHMIGAAMISSDMQPGDLSIEDGTIGTPEELKDAVLQAFGEAAEDDLSILYLCTHGVLSSADDGEVYLLLGDGQSEQPVSAEELHGIIKDIQGQKLLILDACFSGALIGRGSASQEAQNAVPSVFLRDQSVHVLTSASGFESSWYYDSEHLSTGAVSYFASALSTGLGLYGSPEADLNGDSAITLKEMHSYLNMAVPSSSSQLLSSNADHLELPAARTAILSRPLSDFSYGASLISASDPVFDFSFTVTKDRTGIQYRLIEFAGGRWDWENAITFLDGGEDENGMLRAGRKTRTLALEEVLPEDNGYLMLQVFSVSGGELLLCSERLIGVQPAESSESPVLSSPSAVLTPGEELQLNVHLSIPAELTVTVYDAEGRMIRRLASSQMTRPAPGSITQFYWDGQDAEHQKVPPGAYVITCETRIGRKRSKTTLSVEVGA